jgi:hypothetical protein
MQPAPMIILAESGRLESAPVTYSAKLGPGSPANAERALLRILRVEAAGGAPAVVRVFAGLRSADADTLTVAPQFVGFVSLLGRQGQPGHQQDFLLPIPAALVREAQALGELLVTLVPVDAGGKRPAAFSLTHGKIFVQ